MLSSVFIIFTAAILSNFSCKDDNPIEAHVRVGGADVLKTRFDTRWIYEMHKIYFVISKINKIQLFHKIDFIRSKY